MPLRHAHNEVKTMRNEKDSINGKCSQKKYPAQQETNWSYLVKHDKNVSLPAETKIPLGTNILPGLHHPVK